MLQTTIDDKFTIHNSQNDEMIEMNMYNTRNVTAKD